ncbi:hypothetical protein VTN77DRAFT_5782 [Rasamsonia byssochlamydoides]|uniref:uncharacterized protein n=1 Tax=Rasamsonia byssochlamydoides TaxID=89139 RepID=UPI00374408E7
MKEGPPPPPPPHGANPHTTQGSTRYRRATDLPDGNYDIFIIPPHSAGSGFIYLPSLQCHRNSFIAGSLSTLLAVVVWMTILPTVKSLFAPAVARGGVGMIVLVIVVGAAGWFFGALQAKGGASWGWRGGRRPGGFGSGSQYNAGQNSGGPFAQGGSTAGAQHSGNQHNAGNPPPQSPPPPPPPHNHNQGTNKGESKAESKAESEGDKAREEAKRKEEIRRKMEEYKKKREAEEMERKRQREREEMERQRQREREEMERQRQREREEMERQRQREREELEREFREQKEKLEKEAAAAREAAEREREAAERERQAREKAEREAAEREAAERAREEKERAEREAAEREAAAKEAAKKEAAARFAAAKEAAAKKFAAAKEAAEREREAKEKAEKEAAEKAAAAREAARQEALARFAAAKEAAAKEAAAKEAAAREAAAKSPNPTSSTPSEAPPTPSPKKPTQPAASPATEDNTYSFCPYDRPRRPYSGTGTSVSSIYSESSYASSQSTARTTPPPSTRGPYFTKDPDKVIINGVYAFNNAFTKTPIAQLVSGQGSVTDGLVLRITTEGLFIDDDVRGVAQREWDVKAWTMKLIETAEQRGLYVVRASIRDPEGKKYVFVLQESEGWKVGHGIQRLRRSSQVRQLNVAGMPANECKALLSNLGYI